MEVTKTKTGKTKLKRHPNSVSFKPKLRYLSFPNTIPKSSKSCMQASNRDVCCQILRVPPFSTFSEELRNWHKPSSVTDVWDENQRKKSCLPMKLEDFTQTWLIWDRTDVTPI